ncbi:MAG: PspC domain-containing protein [Bacillota bacterium]
MKRLLRSRRERMLGGVCGGLAEYLAADPTVIRLVWVLLSLMWGAGIMLYLAAWIIVPEEYSHESNGQPVDR